MERVSIEDVAKLAGVSISTVSRVISKSDYPISEKTRRKVLKAAEELHYLPNIAAQQLKKEFNNIIGLMVRDISDPYFGEIAKGVTERASELGYLSFVCNTGRSPEREVEYHEVLWQYRVKGIILAGGGFDTEEYKAELMEQLERYKNYGLKIVALAPQGIELPYVTIDNINVGSMITQYLVDRGHCRIAFISGPDNVFTAKERLNGYQDVLIKNGITLNEALVVNSDFSWKGGYEACLELLSHDIQFTSLCCANDNIAIGAMHALREKGLKIPDDISVISIGDITQSKYSDPPLTTAFFPRYEIGKKSVDVIAGLSDLAEHASIVFRSKIIERESVREL
ncbi:MAG: LacI family DNA-binding transcriptional regulator [Clostridia bacterium]